MIRDKFRVGHFPQSLYLGETFYEVYLNNDPAYFLQISLSYFQANI